MVDETIEMKFSIHYFMNKMKMTMEICIQIEVSKYLF